MKNNAIGFLVFFFISTWAQALEITMEGQNFGPGAAPANLETHQRLSYNFGRVLVNSMSAIRYQIRNEGSAPLERASFTVSGLFYEASTNCPRVMAPQQKCGLEIRYWPSFEGYHTGRVIMAFSDQKDVVIDLFAEAYRP